MVKFRPPMSCFQRIFVNGRWTHLHHPADVWTSLPGWFSPVGWWTLSKSRFMSTAALCLYICTYDHICIYIYIHNQKSLHLYICIYVCMYICIYVCMYMYQCNKSRRFFLGIFCNNVALRSMGMPIGMLRWRHLRTTWKWFSPPFWTGNFKLTTILAKSVASRSFLVFFPASCVKLRAKLGATIVKNWMELLSTWLSHGPLVNSVISLW